QGNPSLLRKLESFINLNTSENLSSLHAAFEIQVAEGRAEEAKDTLKKIQKLNPDPAETYRLRGYLALAENNYISAIAQYERAIELKRSAQNLYNIALAHWHHGSYKESETYVDQALSLIPDHYKFLRLKGLTSLYQGKANE